MKGRLFLFGALKLMASSPSPADGGRPRQNKFLDTGSPKTQSLLVYFALHHNFPVQRRQLAFTLWPNTTESAARRNLRQYLHRLRQVLDPLELDALLQDVDGGHILFDPGDALWIDTLAFESEIAQILAHLGSTPQLPPDIWTTLDLYQGDLAPGVYDDWIVPLRAQWQQKYLNTLHTLIQHTKQYQLTAETVLLAERLLHIDPLRESSHRVLMESYYRNGDRGRALQQYEQCQQVLLDELDAAPMPETVALYQRIRQGTPAPADLSPSNDKLLPPSANDAPAKIQRQQSIWPASVEPTAPPFIARQAEIARLDYALAQATLGRGQFLLVNGESGVGKTRLVQEWCGANTHQVTLLTGQCREFETMISYHPLVEALRHGESSINWAWFEPPPPWLGSVAQIWPELADRFPSLPRALAADGVTDRYHLSEGLGRFILTLTDSESNPLVLLLEDLHWADGATWKFLAYIAWHCVQSPLLIIGTLQREYLSPATQHILRSLQRRNQVSFIELGRFSPEETRRLAGFLMDTPNPHRTLLSRIYRETEGNPFFVIEMVNAWFNRTGRSRRKDRDYKKDTSYPLPASIKSVIEARLDHLDETSRNLLATAAAIGRTFNFRVLKATSDLPEEEIVDALETWLARGLVVEEADGYDFSHDKIRAVAYQEVSRARQRIIHRRIAQALETEIQDPELCHPAQLAHYYSHSDAPQRALPYLLKAGDMALAVRSYQEARDFGMKAMRLLRHSSGAEGSRHQERLDLNLQLAAAYAFTGEIDRALPILQEAERLASAIGDEDRLGRIFHRSAQLLWLRNQCRLADEYARRLLRNAEERDNTALLYAALRMLGRVGIALSAYDDAIAYLLRYVKLDDSINPPPDLPVIYGYLAVAYARVGAWQRAFDAGKRGVELAETAGSSSAVAMANMNLAFIHAERHHWARCLDVVQRINPFCEETGFTSYCFMARCLAGRAMAHLGNAEEGVKVLQRALARAKEKNYRVFTHISCLFLAEALLQNGQVPQALRQLEQTLPRIEEADDRWARAIWHRLRAQAQALLPVPNWSAIEANLIEAATRLRQIRARPDLARTYLILRRLYDRAGQSAWAIDCHFRATTIFDELGMLDELQTAQGDAAGDRQGAVVIPNMALRGLVRQE